MTEVMLTGAPYDGRVLLGLPPGTERILVESMQLPDWPDAIWVSDADEVPFRPGAVVYRRADGRPVLEYMP